ncbi:hypothetical protein [Streptomyces sp. NPDC057302]
MTSASVDHTGFRGYRPRLDSPVPQAPGANDCVSVIQAKGEDKGQVPNYR